MPAFGLFFARGVFVVLFVWQIVVLMKLEFSDAFKPLSVTNNSVGSRSAAADHEGNDSSAHVACSGRSQTDAVLHN